MNRHTKLMKKANESKSKALLRLGYGPLYCDGVNTWALFNLTRFYRNVLLSNENSKDKNLVFALVEFVEDRIT